MCRFVVSTRLQFSHVHTYDGYMNNEKNGSQCWNSGAKNNNKWVNQDKKTPVDNQPTHFKKQHGIWFYILLFLGGFERRRYIQTLHESLGTRSGYYSTTARSKDSDIYFWFTDSNNSPNSYTVFRLWRLWEIVNFDTLCAIHSVMKI